MGQVRGAGARLGSLSFGACSVFWRIPSAFPSGGVRQSFSCKRNGLEAQTHSQHRRTESGAHVKQPRPETCVFHLGR